MAAQGNMIVPQMGTFNDLTYLNSFLLLLLLFIIPSLYFLTKSKPFLSITWEKRQNTGNKWKNITLEIGHGWKHGVDTILLLAKVLDERGVGCPFHFHLIFAAIPSLSSGIHIQSYVRAYPFPQLASAAGLY